MPMPALATMSSAGVLTEPNQIADYLFKCFLASENSQSSYYPISSLPYLIDKCTGRINDLPDACIQSLQSIYGSFFESVTTNVLIKDYQPEPEKVVLSISMVLTLDGKMYDLARLVERTEQNPFVVTEM